MVSVILFGLESSIDRWRQQTNTWKLTDFSERNLTFIERFDFSDTIKFFSFLDCSTFSLKCHEEHMFCPICEILDSSAQVTLWARGVKDLWRNKLQNKWNRHWKHCGNESISKAANYIIFIKSGTFTSYQTDFPKERVITQVFDLMSGEKAPKNCGKTTKTFVSFFWKMTDCYTKTWQNIFYNCSW